MPRTSKRPLHLATRSLLAGALYGCTAPSAPSGGDGIEAHQAADLEAPSHGHITAPAPPAAEAPNKTAPDLSSRGPASEEAPTPGSVEAPPQAGPKAAAADPQPGDPSQAGDEATAQGEPPIPASIPASILPAGCAPRHHEDGPWDGKEHFMLSCHRPRLPGWSPAGKSVDYGAGSAFTTYAYRKDGWMLLRSEVCCSSCEPDQLTNCEPHLSARLYPPSDLKECEKSQVCAREGLCVQDQGWCRAPDEA